MAELASYFGLVTLVQKFGEDLYFRVGAHDDTYLHKVVIKCGSYSMTFNKVKPDVNVDYTIPFEWAKSIPNTSTITGTMTLTTYKSDYSTKVGSDVVKTITFKLNEDDGIPTLSVVVSDDDPSITTKFSSFVQIKSKLNVVINATGQYGATIKSYKTTFNNSTYTNASFTTNALNFNGTYTLTTTIVDSRGKSKTTTKEITILPYNHPRIISFSTSRADENGNASPKGAYLLAKVNISITNINDLNDNSYVVEYKKKNSDAWEVLESGSGYSVNKNIVSSGEVLEANSSYDTRLVINDYFKEVVALGSVGTSFKLIHYRANGKALAFGKLSEVEEGVEFGIPAYFDRPIVIGNENKVLWSGSNVMLGTDRVELTEKVETQQNGIVLVFSNAGGDYQFNSFFVPKDFILANLGVGSQFIMTGGVFEKIGTKYLYINNAYITGHNNNGTTGTALSGLTYDNQNFTLRYVIGV